ncbi:hypothetical protein N7522_000494 [Penicillium canescens]|nr:hypothetical protein N7522_000494 [Penicillium canescens]
MATRDIPAGVLDKGAILAGWFVATVHPSELDPPGTSVHRLHFIFFFPCSVLAWAATAGARGRGYRARQHKERGYRIREPDSSSRSVHAILHLRFSGLNRIPIPREIITFLYETPKGYSQHPRSCCGSVDRDASNDNRDYGPIFDEYFDRSQFDYIDPQQAVFGRDGLPALQVLAFGTSPTAFLMRRVHSSWECSGKVPAGLACDDTTRLSFRPVDMSDYSIWDGAVVDAARFLSAS